MATIPSTASGTSTCSASDRAIVDQAAGTETNATTTSAAIPNCFALRADAARDPPLVQDIARGNAGGESAHTMAGRSDVAGRRDRQRAEINSGRRRAAERYTDR